MKVALVHDDLTQRGGAEQVVLSLLRLFREAHLYTSVYDPGGTFPEFREHEIRTTFLQRLPGRGPAARRLLPLYPLAFDSLVLRGYDLVISSSSRFAHGTRTDGAVHLCYCHAPARFLYQPERYLVDGGPAPRWVRPALRPVLAAMRRWDRVAAARPDVYVANSRAVAARIRASYGREAKVIHPPVSMDGIVPANGTPGEFFLAVARLLPYKRLDLAVRVCTERRAPLVVVGDGPDRNRLEALAGETVRFVGTLSRPLLRHILRRCRALLQPGEEDFGIVPLEANAAGRPVVAYAAGGARETVVDGSTGVLFGEQTPESLASALDRLKALDFSSDDLRTHAESFGEERFHTELLDQVAALNGRVAHANATLPAGLEKGAR